MTDAQQFPPGWYADPDNPSVHRWWNGTAWTEARQPANPAPAAPANAAPAAPASAAPAAPAAYPPYQQAPAAYSSAPSAYPSYPSAAPAPVRRDIPTDTPWIWLVVFVPLLSIVPLFFLDWNGFLEAAVLDPNGSASAEWVGSFTGATLLLTLLGYLVIAAQIVFAYLDWRALRARGIDKPFHWAWIFFTLVISNGVYVIGRGVVLRRQTGKGLGPVWAWIAVSVGTLIIGVVFASYLLNQLFALAAIYDSPMAP
ncbi:DUF2510 domain-containing protein [Microbacterium lushaniae]|uniref:DUF2510 domain-containing protein n=1 Tax=Microbacterium lushaniae TaxID=2614639 RepID=A0A5J6L5Q1_9MICO|nr:DUF2510 domain-containing protein [Microbacterium lushaniae]QEW03797.1 DUF2510 domain-containing protein [Microbacterium lushaniae]